VTVQNCKKGEYLPLVYHATAVHDSGFFLKSADSRCLDGNKFVSCTGTSANQLLWGVGVKYVWGKANSSTHALKWGLIDGQLSQGNGKMCVARLQDNSAGKTDIFTCELQHMIFSSGFHDQSSSSM
jgi:hypothetical protein